VTGVVEWPPDEKVKLIGSLSRPEVVGVGVALAVFGVGIAVGRPLLFGCLAVPVVVWTMGSWRGAPARSRVMAELRWLMRRDRDWTASVAVGDVGRDLAATRQAPTFLQGVVLRSVESPHAGARAGVVQVRGSFTVVLPVSAASLAFEPPEQQVARFQRWGDVLGGLCVEPGSGLRVERVAWTDLHSPAALDRNGDERLAHRAHGPAALDYRDFVNAVHETATCHRVVVSVTVTRAAQLRAARGHGFDGEPDAMMSDAAALVASEVAGDLQRAGFSVGAPLTAGEISRLLSTALHPFDRLPPSPWGHERFGVPIPVTPHRMRVERQQVIVDDTYHRVFAITWPRIAVDPAWAWMPLAADGPKLTSVVFEPVAPSRADARREALASRSAANNQILGLRRGRVRTVDLRKTGSLHAAERAVAAGHQELDGYGLVAVAGRSLDDLNHRVQVLRQRLREAGRAGLVELDGWHDVGLAAALPIGHWVRPTVE
jgi:hypothetical protein